MLMLMPYCMPFAIFDFLPYAMPLLLITPTLLSPPTLPRLLLLSMFTRDDAIFVDAPPFVRHCLPLRQALLRPCSRLYFSRLCCRDT